MKNIVCVFACFLIVISLPLFLLSLEDAGMKAQVNEGRFHLTDTSELKAVVILFSLGMSIDDTMFITGLAEEDIVKVYKELMSLNDSSLKVLKRALRSSHRERDR